MTRSVAVALDEIVPAAIYEGSLTADDRAAYDAMNWLDAREKPAWAAVVARRERDPDKGELALFAAARRYAIEVSGVVVVVHGESVTMSTRREDRDGARDTLLAILASLRADGAVFKFVEGPRAATNAEMLAAVAAAFSHVQGAYDREGMIASRIADGSLTTTAEIDAAFA